MNMTGFECVACGELQGADYSGYVCPSCGNNLQVTYDYERVREELDLERPFQQRRRDLFRYLPLLPLSDLSLAPSLRIGSTPLFRARRLGRSIGLEELWLKDEGLNPSASFKDRASACCRSSGRRSRRRRRPGARRRRRTRNRSCSSRVLPVAGRQAGRAPRAARFTARDASPSCRAAPPRADAAG